MYEIVSITYNKNDGGSIYIAPSPGKTINNGKELWAPKYSYHPDGVNHIATDLKAPADFVKQLEERRSVEYGIRDGKSYMNFKPNIELKNVQEMLSLSNWSLYFKNIHNATFKKYLQPSTRSKIDKAIVIDGQHYRHLTIRFFLVGNRYLQSGLESLASKEKYSFKHPLFDLSIVVAIFDD